MGEGSGLRGWGEGQGLEGHVKDFGFYSKCNQKLDSLPESWLICSHLTGLVAPFCSIPKLSTSQIASHPRLLSLTPWTPVIPPSSSSIRLLSTFSLSQISPPLKTKFQDSVSDHNLLWSLLFFHSIPIMPVLFKVFKIWLEKTIEI